MTTPATFGSERPKKIVGWQISFQSRREMEDWLRGRGYRVRRYNTDGTFDTEKITTTPEHKP